MRTRVSGWTGRCVLHFGGKVARMIGSIRGLCSRIAPALGLTLVPIAVLAIPPSLNAAFAFNTGTCFVNAGDGVASCGPLSQVNPIGGDPDFNWVELSPTITTGPAAADDYSVTETGTVTGSITAGSIPISWHLLFDANASVSDETITWTVDVGLFVSGTFYDNGAADQTFHLTNSSPVVIDGTASIDVPA